MTDLTADAIRTPWPFDPAEDLLDHAQEHLADDQPDRAIAVWKLLIKAGGEAGDWARLAYAEYLFESEQEDAARTELATLLAGWRVFEAPWRHTAELLEKRGELECALLWYSAAVGDLSKVATSDEPRWANRLRAGRRRLRWALEIPLDREDLRAPTSKDEQVDKQFMVTRLVVEPEVIDGRLRFWTRDNCGTTHWLWSRLEAQGAEALYYRYVEGVLRAAEGGRRLTVVPCTFESWLRMLEVADDARRLADVPSLISRYGEDRAIPWPPGRNQVCWCGSGIKYKKCCGAAA